MITYEQWQAKDKPDSIFFASSLEGGDWEILESKTEDCVYAVESDGAESFCDLETFVAYDVSEAFFTWAEAENYIKQKEAKE